MNKRISVIGMSLAQLCSLNVEFFHGELLSNEEFDYIFETCPQAFWLRDNSNPLNPHTALTAGGCSNGFVNTLQVLSYANLCYILAYHMAVRVRQVWPGPVDWVVGSDHAGAVFSQNVALFFPGARHDFTTKVPKSGDIAERQIWNRFTIGKEEWVLRIEELMTTGTTNDRVVAGIGEFHTEYPINYIPVIGICVNRSGMVEYKDSVLVSNRDYDITSYSRPEVCQWCKDGSPRIENPKQNWGKLKSISI
ncbi:MAG: hypothetical protein ACD_8C00034G0006 [uncultured bacterium]|nr:MAG: hypothetical protein ACD_8C00034G0006 [uncultured bacterium]